MSKIKQAIERKFPRYVLAVSTPRMPQQPSGLVTPGGVWLEAAQEIAERVVKERNELIDKLIEASELLAELAPHAVETTPQVCKRWRV